MPITKANIEDISALLKLVNSAYRGEASTKGWTTEAHLLKGDLRTDEPTLLKQFQNKNAVILKFTNERDEITGCVYLEQKDHKIYLGMLSVSPAAQSQGIGKKLLQAAEAFANERQCEAVYMTVISVRQELIAWYKRHGYVNTGETKPFPVEERFGVPTQALEFIVLEKIIAQRLILNKQL
ncbi:GNAT family N-acetyltransferase [Panacibacter ginsenosidivorans]|uniref:GNAT family N-acetyltransferase n=1 Tax=Panacibacter ginsenosidivorans TaxID=1813871 RepID=A0A5B8V9Y4_9BACT|nr:GNAT family N-acetyltransferase [Panacibacter ginsenosidivorans]QEC67671.1 GNAT family N-acetyltransferase [Panacibacter ginsenosidivorans]